MTVAPTYVSEASRRRGSSRSRAARRTADLRGQTCWPRVTSQVNDVYGDPRVLDVVGEDPGVWMIRSTRSQSFEQYSATSSSGFPVL